MDVLSGHLIAEVRHGARDEITGSDHAITGVNGQAEMDELIVLVIDNQQTTKPGNTDHPYGKSHG